MSEYQQNEGHDSESDASGGRLDIAYVFMRFPMASQPFAISDVLALRDLGHQVHTYALSRKDPEYADLLDKYGLSADRGSQFSSRSIGALLNPGNWPLAVRLLGFLARHHTNWPATFKALALAPRIIEVSAALNRTPPDVVHAFWGHYPALVLPLIDGRAAEPVVRSLFLGAYDMTSHLVPFSVPIANACDSVWTHAHENVASLMDLGVDPERIQVAHRGIPLDLADEPQPERDQFRLCTAGGLHPEKNFDRVLEVFQRVRAECPRASLLIAGDGPERRNLEATAARLGIADAVEFAGHLSREALFREMARSRVFLFLSGKVSERLPNVVKEAMLAGCHVVVSETPGIRELVTPGATGDVMTSTAPDAVAEWVVPILGSTFSEMGENGGDFVRQNFSSIASMRKYVASWRASLGRQKNRQSED